MNCYAETMAARFSDDGQPYHGLARRTPSGPRWTGEVRFIEEHLLDPLRWQRPRRVFVNSMSDLFHEWVSRETIARIFAVMWLAQQHTFQCLTKRAEKMREVLTAPWFANLVADEAVRILRTLPNAKRMRTAASLDFPLPNVWLGVSVEDQSVAHRITDLVDTPAAIRFVSAEPLIGALNLKYAEIDWLIVGGESGPNARECRGEWVRSLVEQCSGAGVACFVKQLGLRFVDRSARVAGHDARGWPPDWRRMHHSHGGDPTEWPPGYDVREFPGVRA